MYGIVLVVVVALLSRDTIVLDGLDAAFEQLSRRRRGAGGDRDHADVVAEHRQRAAAERRNDEDTPDLPPAERAAGDRDDSASPDAEASRAQVSQ